MFYGQQRHQLDAKNRFRVPSKYRSKFGDVIFLSRGSNNCIYVFSDESVKELLFDRFSSVGTTGNVNLIKAKRLIFANTFDLTDDGQGRFTLPEELMKHAKISKNIVSVGAGNWLEIWGEELWDEHNNENGDYDELMSALVGAE